MNKVNIVFSVLVCLALIGCTININTGTKVDPEYAMQMTLTAIADQYFNNQSPRNPTGQPLSPPQPQAQSQEQQPLPPPQNPVLDITITPSITPTPIPCLLLGKVVDVTLPDGTQLQPGTSETKTWRLTNKGSCAWDSSFSLAYKSGNLPVRNPYVNLSRTVRPGETIDVSVPVLVPREPGTYTSYFWLRNGSGDYFGSGVDARQTFWVKVSVQQEFKVTDFGFAYANTIKKSDSQGKCFVQIPYSITANAPGKVKFIFQSVGIETPGKICINKDIYEQSIELEMDFNGPGTEFQSYSTSLMGNCGYSFSIRIREPNILKSDIDHMFYVECVK